MKSFRVRQLLAYCAAAIFLIAVFRPKPARLRMRAEPFLTVWPA